MSLSEKSDSLVSTLGAIDASKWTIIDQELNISDAEALLFREHQDICSLPYTGEE